MKTNSQEVLKEKNAPSFYWEPKIQPRPTPAPSKLQKLPGKSSVEPV